MFIIPIEKGNPLRNTPYLVYGLIAVNIIVFIYTFFVLDFELTVAQYGFTPSHPEVLTSFTSMFMHAGILHIIGNMFFMYMFGDNVEDVSGILIFPVVYVLCGLGGTGLHYLLNMNSEIPCVGASGAISGLVGMYMVLFPNAHVDIVFYLRTWVIAEIHAKATGAILAWFGMQTVLGLISFFANDVPIFSIAFWAHVGGLLTGCFLGFLLRLMGIEAKPPHKVVKIERKEEGAFWCPHCGKPNEFLNFGKYLCEDCGARFVFSKEVEKELW